MKIFALADLHLSLAAPFDEKEPQLIEETKPMSVFGHCWEGHTEKIYHQWQETVTEDDVVLIAGDISWAMHLDAAGYDLDFIGALPGRKVMIRGNHDYWWHSLKKIRAVLPPRMEIIQNDAVLFDDFAICGTRLWLLPGAGDFSAKDMKIYQRELLREELSLKAAKGRPVINMNHFMPVSEKGGENEVTALFQRYGVIKTVYGHLHDKSHALAVEGEEHGIEFFLTSGDYLQFKPRLIAEF